ncbi:hypothetical protein BWI97_27085 [Siphonobacter sp. BAB-5405]|uniref:hypothetical protein n=1 Tax=Siphonobacter sp. BAB-5405 TaxID=1864825 RepID=UPI000C807BBC|nr:hypothetical protein [Siphonobacter sp. BAB-5405]PMD83728.1 hypothetical protein BWI97_27085 [Siphonobacter sp. BAB-5405]
MKKKHKLINLGCTILLMGLLSSCASIQNISSCVKDEPVGFIEGLIHGFFILPAFIISLFNDTVAIYAVNNNGHLYDLGFAIGVGSFSASTRQQFINILNSFKKEKANNDDAYSLNKE